MTFGDVLYEFCNYRISLKLFGRNRLQIRKIRRMLTWTAKVV